MFGSIQTNQLFTIPETCQEHIGEELESFIDTRKIYSCEHFKQLDDHIVLLESKIRVRGTFVESHQDFIENIQMKKNFSPKTQFELTIATKEKIDIDTSEIEANRLEIEKIQQTASQEFVVIIESNKQWINNAMKIVKKNNSKDESYCLYHELKKA